MRHSQCFSPSLFYSAGMGLASPGTDKGDHGDKARYRTGGRDQALRRRRRRRQCQPAHPGRLLLLPAGPERLRQDHDLAHDRRPRGGDRGRHHPGQRKHHQPAPGQPRHGDDVPELRAVSAPRLHRQRGLQPAHARRRQGHPPRARPRHAEARPDGAVRRPAAGAALGRPAAARGAGARADHRPAGAAARRAVVGARSLPAHRACARS